VRKPFLNILLYVLATAIVLVGGIFLLNRPQLVIVAGPIPVEFPDDRFSHTVFESLLRNYVDSEGNVAYQRWYDNEQDRSKLASYLAAVASFSPDNAVERFHSRSERLAYWLYSYNAYVIYSVLANWPLESVTDVKAPIEAVTGFGFFYQQRFLFGGEAYSLYAVEHRKILKSFQDPRIHFVLNCASDSCPVLRPELPVGNDLEVLLVRATEEFINDRRNVSVDHEKELIVLSTIFEWYRQDFLNDLRRRGQSLDNGVIGYIAESAGPDLEAELLAGAEYDVVYEDYDWSLNDVRN